VRLVDEHQGVGRQVIDQRRRRLARLAAGEVARVVLDALAEAQFVEHFQVEAGSLLDALASTSCWPAEKPRCVRAARA
jgi:hypothetical protein